LVEKTEDLPSAALATNIIENNGYGNLGRLDLKRYLSGKILFMSPYINSYSEGMTGKSTIKDLETLFQLTYLKFTAPRLDNDAFKNFREKQRSVLKNKYNIPTQSVTDTINLIKTNYSDRLLIWDSKTAEKVSQEKAYAIYKERFANPADFTFVIVGTFNPDSIKPLVLTYLGGLKTSKQKENWKDNKVRHPKGNISKTFKRKMKVEKASVNLFYYSKMKYNIKNYVMLDIVEAILKIRYNETLREEKSATYSIQVNGKVNPLPVEEASISISFSTNKEQVDTLIRLAKLELEKIKSNGVTAEELANVKKNLLKQNKKKSPTWLLDAIKMKEMYGIDLIEDYNSTVNKITEKDIQKVISKILKKGNLMEFKLLTE
jgi:zinc protease